MGGIFRITKAEFIKIFKKPSVYIMGIILAFTLVVSLLFFQPENSSDTKVNLTGSSISEIYNKYNGTAGTDTKQNYDNNLLISENKLNFYASFNNRIIAVNNANIELNTAFLNFKNVANNNEATLENKDNALNLFNEKISALEKTFKNFDSFDKNTFFIEYQKQSTYLTTLTYIDELNNTIANSGTEHLTIIKNIEANQRLSKIINLLSNYQNFIKTTVLTEIDHLTTLQDDYYFYILNNQAGGDAIRKEKWNNVSDQLEKIRVLFLSICNSDPTLIFINANTLKTINSTFVDYKNILSILTDEKNDKADYEKHKDLITKLNNLKLNLKLKNNISTFENYEIKNDTITSLLKTKENVLVNLVKINSKITSFEQLHAVSTSTKHKSEINNYISQYKEFTNNYKTYVNITLLLEASNKLNITSVNDYENLEKFNLYETKEDLAIVTYLINNNDYSFNYDDVFAFNRNSSNTTTAWDFMYFAIKISSLIIIIFTIMMAANLVASEHDSGTIKLLAMRPYKRTKIITGKLFATLIFGFIFVLFSSLIGFVAGACMFPLTTTPILAVFNSTNVFIISPILLMVLNIFSIFLEISFFTIIALALCTIFRSFAGAISTSLIIFLLAIGLNILLGGFMWYSFIPFVNIDFFRYLGGSFLSTNTTALSNLFAAPLTNLSNFFVSLGIYGGTLAIILFVAYMVFKKRDF